MAVVRSPPPPITPAALCHITLTTGGAADMEPQLQQRVVELSDFGAIHNRRGQVFEINLKTAKEMADGVSLAARMFSFARRILSLRACTLSQSLCFSPRVSPCPPLFSLRAAYSRCARRLRCGLGTGHL